MPTDLQLEDEALWKQRFRAPVVIWTQIALANRARGLAVTNRSGVNQLYAWEIPTGEMRQLTEHPAGIRYGVVSGDGRYVYYLDDEKGNEIGHFVRLPFEGGKVQDITPGFPPYSSSDYSSSGSGSHFGFLRADDDGFRIYTVETKINGDIGAALQLFHSAKLTFGPIFSYGGEVALIMSTERAAVQHFNLLAFDTVTGEQIAELWDGEGTSLEPLGFPPLPGDLRVTGTTNRSGVKRPFIWNPRTDERMDLDFPDLAGEVVPFDWAPDGNCLLICQFTQAVQHLFLYEIASQKLTKLDHPGGTFGIFAAAGTYFGTEGEIFAQWQAAAYPSQLIALDAQSGRKTRNLLTAGDVPPGHAWRSVTFPSSDGQLVQGWLGVPDGQGPFPTILHTHGGPTSVMTERWMPDSQAWIDHGFAFLTINYHGSITFGREFEEKLWGNVGFWEMEDLEAARNWLVNNKIAQSDGIFLSGLSYGGYITLMGMGKLPDLWAGGMAGVAISDWAMMFEDAADTLKAYDVALFGGTPQEKPEQYRLSSPITYAENVKAPILIIQGRNDTRTPARPIEVYEQHLKALGKPIEVHWFDAGHWGGGTEQEIRDFEIMLQFAYRVLGI